LAATAFHLWLAYAAADVSHNSSGSSGLGGFSACSASITRTCEDTWLIPCWRNARGAVLDAGHSPLRNGSTTSSRASTPATGAKHRRRGQLWRDGSQSLVLYLLPRLVVLAWFAAWMAALPASGLYHLHLHHYTLGWAIASMAAFNHPVSGLQLAVGTAVLVQVRFLVPLTAACRRQQCTRSCCHPGLKQLPQHEQDTQSQLIRYVCLLLQGAGAYGFDPLFQPAARPPGGCLPVASNDTGQMVCAFWAADQWSLRFCSGGWQGVKHWLKLLSLLSHDEPSLPRHVRAWYVTDTCDGCFACLQTSPGSPGLTAACHGPGQKRL
jgi:hypothetical protein